MAAASGAAPNASFFVEPELSRQNKIARGGIVNPSVETLSPDRHRSLFRLGHSKFTDEQNLCSPWWTDYENFVALKSFAQRNSISLTVTSRVHNAQAPEFGPADTLYRIMLKAPILAFQGSGRPIVTDNRIYAPSTVTQTFVPGLGLGRQGPRSPMWHEMFSSFERTTVEKGLITLYGE